MDIDCAFELTADETASLMQKLLAALRSIQEMAEHDLRENYCSGFMHQIEANARAAIAKARGEAVGE